MSITATATPASLEVGTGLKRIVTFPTWSQQADVLDDVVYDATATFTLSTGAETTITTKVTVIPAQISVSGIATPRALAVQISEPLSLRSIVQVVVRLIGPSADDRSTMVDQ